MGGVEGNVQWYAVERIPAAGGRKRAIATATISGGNPDSNTPQQHGVELEAAKYDYNGKARGDARRGSTSRGTSWSDFCAQTAQV